jgi:hypothetical protein
MAKYVIKEGTVTVNNVDLSDHVRAVDVNMVKDEVEATGLNGPGLHQYLPGLARESFVFTFASDFDSGKVDATLFPLYRNESIFLVSVTPFQLPITSSNPNFTARCQLFNYDPLNGQVGALAETQVTMIATEAIVKYTT